jgi:hypothetical protein
MEHTVQPTGATSKTQNNREEEIEDGSMDTHIGMDRLTLKK